ncbi:MAG: type 1 glutamine amidotransferase [Desulfosarcina sp.]|nr:type 1 glutamine amidotransferase [Desulfobacterales bacterium]
MRLHYLQHVAFEGLGRIRSWAEATGAGITSSRLYQDQPLPGTDAFDLLVIMGGPMSTSDVKRYAWLAGEKQFIRKAVAAGKAILGVCLGAQLIADALEARVYPHTHREIGWYDIYRTEAGAGHPIGNCLPPRLKVFHWHGDTFDLPAGALHIASSEACRHQGFVIDRQVIGLQFHLETTPVSLRALVDNCRQELTTGPYIQSAEEIFSTGDCYPANHDVLYSMLNRLTS